MIRINLLPEKEVKQRRAAERIGPARQVSPLTMLIIAAVVVLLGSFYYFGVQRRVASRKVAEDSLNEQVNRLTKEIAKRKEGAMKLQEAERITKSMLDIVYALDPENRLLWSEKLNQLSDLLPQNVYISRLIVTEAVSKKETASSKRQHDQWVAEQKAQGKKTTGKAAQAGAPPTVYYPEIVQTLQLTGIAYSESDSERIRLINEFYNNLLRGSNEAAKISADFMKGFAKQIDFGGAIPRVVGGRGIAEFSFTLRSKPTAPKDLGTSEPLRISGKKVTGSKAVQDVKKAKTATKGEKPKRGADAEETLE